MNIKEGQSAILIITLLMAGIIMIKTPVGLALIGISLFFLYKRLSGS